MNQSLVRFLLYGQLLLLASCSGLRDQHMPQDIRSAAGPSSGHLQAKAPVVEPADIPEPVRVAPALPEPETIETQLTHTVVVFDVPVRELLFSLARDAGLDLDIEPAIDGQITMNAVEQPLANILKRITEYTDLRYEVQEGVLKIRRDTPYLQTYVLNSLNMSRQSRGSVSVSTQIQATGQGAGQGGAGGGSGGRGGVGRGNNSDTSVTILSEYNFWDTLTGNFRSILASNNVIEGEGVSDSSSDIIVNRESGIVMIRATRRQHSDIRSFIDSVEASTQRQVMIEATIAEVKLSDSYQAGIDWQLINSQPTSGVEITQAVTSLDLAQPPTFNIAVTDLDFGGNELQATLSALETFGDVSVVSSPKIMAMNNQTAVLKVVDNLIYFTVEVNIDNASQNVGSGRLVTFETDVNTVPVGFVMSVTPFIGADDMVTLNVRPTISRVIDFVTDPNPALAAEDVISQIPVIQAREVESVLKVPSGSIAVIGGLMQDQVKKTSTGVPLLGRLPFIGPAFRYDENETSKTELVIFIRPRIIKNASIDGDLSDFRRYLPARE